jgi:hypothetical protein
MSTMTETNARPDTRQKVGLALAGVYSFMQVPGAFMPTPEGEEGPPYFILVLGALLGVAGVVAAVKAWRGSRTATRVLAGIRILVGVAVVWTIAAVYLMFSPSRATTDA